MGENMKNKSLIIALIICVISVVGFILTLNSYNKSKEFVKPEFEKNVKVGMPKLTKEDGFEEFEVSEDYIVYMTGETKLNDGKLVVYFTSKKSNDVYVKLRILKDDKIVGETGLLKPGEYIKEVKLDKSLKKDDKITIKVMGYETETYYSAGSISLNTKVW